MTEPKPASTFYLKRRVEYLREQRDIYKAALDTIAGCEKRADGDLVDVARLALKMAAGR